MGRVHPVFWPGSNLPDRGVHLRDQRRREILSAAPILSAAVPAERHLHFLHHGRPADHQSELDRDRALDF